MLPHLILAYAIVAVFVGNVLLSLFVIAGKPNTRADDRGDVRPPLAIIRPVRGVHPRSKAANRALVRQRYRGELTWCFVATRSNDPGLEQARREHDGERNVGFGVSHARMDAIDKASNMIQGWKASRIPFVGFCDSDIELKPDALQRAMAAFDDPRVAAVFAPVLYRPSSLVQRISALVVSGDKLVTVRALDRVGLLAVMEGGLMIVRRSAVEQIGPIDEILSETIADDLRLATVLTGRGARIRVADPVVHPQNDAPLVDLLRQYHRWMVCVRSERPSILLVQVLLHPVAVPLLALLSAPTSRVAWTLLVITVSWRVALSVAIDRRIADADATRANAWCFARPIADLLHFSVGVAALAWPRVNWAGREYSFRRRVVGATTRKPRVVQL